MQRKGNLAHLWMILLRARRAETKQGWITAAGLRKEARTRVPPQRAPREDVTLRRAYARGTAHSFRRRH